MDNEQIKTNDELAAEIVNQIRDELGENGRPAPENPKPKTKVIHNDGSMKKWNRTNHDPRFSM